MPIAFDVAEERLPAQRVTMSHQIRGLGGEARELVELSRRLAAYNLGYLSVAWVLAFGSIALFWADPAWYTFAISFFVVSSRQQALLNCEHEAVHGKFLPGRRFNEFVGRYLCAAAVGSPFGAAKARHLSHHRLLGSHDDPDKELYSGQSKRTVQGLIWYFLSGLLGGYAGMVLMGPRAPRASAGTRSVGRDLRALVLVQGAIALSLSLAFAWWTYPALWIAPLASVTALCHLIRSFVEHAITDSEAPAHSNRLITIRSFFVERAFVSPYFMNYHAEHHLLPSVPAPRLKQLQDRLIRREDAPTVLVRSSYVAALRRYASALRD